MVSFIRLRPAGYGATRGENIMDEDIQKLADRLRRYYGRDPFTPIEITITAFEEYGYAEWTLPIFVALIKGATDSIPEANRESALVLLEGGNGESTKLEITYRRLQTRDEVEADVQRGLAYVNSSDRREREQYEKLRAKFEGSK